MAQQPGEVTGTWLTSACAKENGAAGGVLERPHQVPVCTYQWPWLAASTRLVEFPPIAAYITWPM